MEQGKKEKPINIELSEEVAEGTYSNLAIISHSSSEFVIDFVRVMPIAPKAIVKSRIILTPEHTKRLLAALQDNVTKFERQYGQVKTSDNEFNPPIPINFGGQGEA